MLDVRRLRVLGEVARRGSFSAAAEALTYSQSAVSQQIATLEREAGARLVERQGRGIRLTDAGRALVRRADAILVELAAADAELQAIAGLRAGRVRVSTFASAATALLPAAVTAFRAAHPAVQVELSLVEATEEAVGGLRAGPADVGLAAPRPGRGPRAVRGPDAGRAAGRPPPGPPAQPAPGRPGRRALGAGRRPRLLGPGHHPARLPRRRVRAAGHGRLPDR